MERYAALTGGGNVAAESEGCELGIACVDELVGLPGEDTWADEPGTMEAGGVLRAM